MLHDIYISELPQNCVSCPFYDSSCIKCVITKYHCAYDINHQYIKDWWKQRHHTCVLKDIHTHDMLLKNEYEQQLLNKDKELQLITKYWSIKEKHL